MNAVTTPSRFRSSPLASDVIEGWLESNPLAVPPPVSRFDVGRMELFNEDRWQDVFSEMRATAPVNKVTGTIHGDYWNVCTHKGVQHVESLPELYSSSYRHGGVSMVEAPKGVAHNVALPMFIAMDRPDHTVRRRTVAPAFTPTEVARLAAEVRERTGKVLDSLPLGETFDWVDKVSIELTTSMLAILFDFPREDERLLPFWSDWVTAIEAGHIAEVAQGRMQASQDMAAYFQDLWKERSRNPVGSDLLSVMARSPDMAQMGEQEFMGTLMLLVTGGNDTTRNTMSGFIQALDAFPEQRAILESDPSVADNAMAEVIRYVSPVVHMRRTATADAELMGQQIRAGDKLVLWYLSANHDETVFTRPDQLDLLRENARRHLAFGYGIHRCVGARVAELQLRTLIEEMASRRLRAHVTGTVKRGGGALMHAFRKLEVQLERY